MRAAFGGTPEPAWEMSSRSGVASAGPRGPKAWRPLPQAHVLTGFCLRTYRRDYTESQTNLRTAAINVDF